MIKCKIVFTAIFIFSIFIINAAYAGKCWNGESSGTAPWIVKKTVNHDDDSCEYADVNYCVNKVAKTEETVYVPAGICTWNNTLLITKAISIIGAGIGKTIINSSYKPDNPGKGSSIIPEKYLITILPLKPENNPHIRLSGFTFNFGSTSNGILYRNNSTTYDCTNVRLDHLAISSAPFRRVFERYGLTHGVMDNCTIKGFMNSSAPATLWSTNGWNFGTASNFYFEDNTWLPYSNTSRIQMDVNGAARFAFRYNKVIVPTDINTMPLLMHHGNQFGIQSAGFGSEIYENTVLVDNHHGWNTMFFVQRGGKSLTYNNKIKWTTLNTGVTIWLREEHQDSDGSGVPINLVNGQPQHISDSYFWGNTKNGEALNPVADKKLMCSVCGKIIPSPNQDFWVEETSFDGTSGMGVGLRASRPDKCTKGVGYWVTDESKLYRCVDSKTWLLYYKPYPYPHPLRNKYDLVK